MFSTVIRRLIVTFSDLLETLFSYSLSEAGASFRAKFTTRMPAKNMCPHVEALGIGTLCPFGSLCFAWVSYVVSLQCLFGTFLVTGILDLENDKAGSCLHRQNDGNWRPVGGQHLAKAHR